MSASHPLAVGPAADLCTYLRARRGGMPSSQAVRRFVAEKHEKVSGHRRNRVVRAIAAAMGLTTNRPARGAGHSNAKRAIARPRRLEV